ncbi:uncharacterized protein LAESUDRAFT_563604 [Laetiporus sulphureus 93-53]|uniref:Uncharacterized protein n=1 Tax=Laetiporus sulphureus 93-53 TaxID=1314785 RepID=A0A165B477_9APHY|nr:uncharacterized protein LAESUDRAFT_563604 [Laetiporus sulphureus 93-53]KZT00192.1 hypothetical protein LAESUDRAFT_563604 [Laetiporus sulphureus 93-53]
MRPSSTSYLDTCQGAASKGERIRHGMRGTPQQRNHAGYSHLNYMPRIQLYQAIDIVHPETGVNMNTMIPGLVKYSHVRKDILNERGTVDPAKFKVISGWMTSRMLISRARTRCKYRCGLRKRREYRPH